MIAQILEFVKNRKNETEKIKTTLHTLRKKNTIRPQGQYKKGYWQPTQQEYCLCCKEIKPTTKSPHALAAHCKSKKHINNLSLEHVIRSLPNKYIINRSFWGNSELLITMGIPRELRKKELQQIQDWCNKFNIMPLFIKQKTKSHIAITTKKSISETVDSIKRYIANQYQGYLEMVFNYQKNFKKVCKTLESLQSKTLENIQSKTIEQINNTTIWHYPLPKNEAFWYWRPDPETSIDATVYEHGLFYSGEDWGDSGGWFTIGFQLFEHFFKDQHICTIPEDIYQEIKRTLLKHKEPAKNGVQLFLFNKTKRIIRVSVTAEDKQKRIYFNDTPDEDIVFSCPLTPGSYNIEFCIYTNDNRKEVCTTFMHHLTVKKNYYNILLFTAEIKKYQMRHSIDEILIHRP